MTKRNTIPPQHLDNYLRTLARQVSHRPVEERIQFIREKAGVELLANDTRLNG